MALLLCPLCRLISMGYYDFITSGLVSYWFAVFKRLSFACVPFPFCFVVCWRNYKARLCGKQLVDILSVFRQQVLISFFLYVWSTCIHFLELRAIFLSPLYISNSIIKLLFLSVFILFSYRRVFYSRWFWKTVIVGSGSPGPCCCLTIWWRNAFG